MVFCQLYLLIHKKLKKVLEKSLPPAPPPPTKKRPFTFESVNMEIITNQGGGGYSMSAVPTFLLQSRKYL